MLEIWIYTAIHRAILMSYKIIVQNCVKNYCIFTWLYFYFAQLCVHKGPLYRNPDQFRNSYHFLSADSTFLRHHFWAILVKAALFILHSLIYGETYKEELSRSKQVHVSLTSTYTKRLWLQNYSYNILMWISTNDYLVLSLREPLKFSNWPVA